MSQYRAKRLPVHRGPAGWAAILPPAPDPVAMEQDCTADLVIIGAGFAGLAAAERARRLDPNLRIVVCEAGRLAEAASGRNSGFMIDLPHDLASDDYAGQGDDLQMITLNRRAIGFASETVGHHGVNPDYFRRDGKVNGAAGAKGHGHNESYARHLAELNEPCEMLDAQGMYDLTGSRHYRSGLYTPGTVMLQPAGYIRGVGAGLRRAGVSVFENTPVNGFQRVGTDWRVQTPKGQITTPRIILANNGHLESFGIARRRLMHVFLFAAITPVLSGDQIAKLGGAPRWGVTPSDPMGTTMRRITDAQGGDRIVTRTCAAFRPGMESTEGDLTRASHVMQGKFDQRFPQLAGLAPEHVWAGHLCLSRNGVTLLGQVDEGVYSACCQNGLGTARGTLTGMGAAELALGQPSDIADFFAKEPEPTRLPPAPMSTIGANAVLRFKEYRAGNE